MELKILKAYLFNSNGRNEEDCLSVFYGADNNICRALCTSMYSIYGSDKETPLFFSIITDGFTPDNLEKLKNLSDTCQIPIQIFVIDTSFLNNTRTASHLPFSTYFRFAGPLLLKNPRILYLDTDIIANHCDLRQLWKTDLGDHVIGAVRDAEWMVAKRTRLLKLSSADYFNAGVLLIDRKKWILNRISDKLIQTLTERDDLSYFDQDVLNIVLDGNVTYLNRIWNQYEVNKANSSFHGLLHFTAHPKPWTVAWDLRDDLDPYIRQIYRKMESHTPYTNIPPEEPANAHAIRIYARLLRKRGKYLDWIRYCGKYIKMKT